MYEEKVRKFKCYHCPDCNLYAGSETKTIHGRRMKPNTKYCTGGQKVIIFRSDDPKVTVPKWCPKRRVPPTLRIYHFRSPEIEVGESMLAAKGISFSPIPAAMQCGMRETPLTLQWNLQSKSKSILSQNCSLCSCCPMRFWKSTMASALTASLWNVSAMCGAFASKAILHAKTSMKSLTTKRFDPMESCRCSIHSHL